jgi:hypothetical protein
MLDVTVGYVDGDVFNPTGFAYVPLNEEGWFVTRFSKEDSGGTYDFVTSDVNTQLFFGKFSQPDRCIYIARHILSTIYPDGIKKMPECIVVFVDKDNNKQYQSTVYVSGYDLPRTKFYWSSIRFREYVPPHVVRTE